MKVIISSLLVIGLSAAAAPTAQAAIGIGCPQCDIAFTVCIRGAITEAQGIACQDKLMDCREAKCLPVGGASLDGQEPRMKMSPAAPRVSSNPLRRLAAPY
jgi:hypothetical protein